MANAGYVAVPARYNPSQTFVPMGPGGQCGPITQNFGATQQNQVTGAGLSPEVNTYFGSNFPLSGGQFAEGLPTPPRLKWSRPYFANTAGRDWDQPVTTFRVGYNALDSAGTPETLPPAFAKRYDQATMRLGFGSWAQSFPSGDGQWVGWRAMPGQRWRAEYHPTGFPRQMTAQPRMAVQPSSKVRLAFFGAQPQMEGPWWNLLTDTAQTGSWGQFTQTLPATPLPVYGGSVYG